MKSEGKKEFSFLREYFELIRAIEKEYPCEGATFALAILDYAFLGEVFKFKEPLVQACFECVKYTIDNDWEKMEADYE